MKAYILKNNNRNQLKLRKKIQSVLKDNKIPKRKKNVNHGQRKKKHHRHEHYEQNKNNFAFQQQPIPPLQQQQQQPFFADLPPHLRVKHNVFLTKNKPFFILLVQVHQQPLYTSYNQVYEESIRRGDIFHKQAKRSTRLPPEAKQKLLPHEEDRKKPYPVVGYFQQPFNDGHQPFNPYQPYTARPNFFGPTVPYNPRQAWSNAPSINIGEEQKIDRLKNHIHTLEHELHKLQKKLNKTTLNTTETSTKDEHHRSKRRSKRDTVTSPRQTPVIVELNSTANEEHDDESSRKHRHRTRSKNSSQKEQSIPQQSVETSGQHTSTFNNQNSKQLNRDSRER